MDSWLSSLFSSHAFTGFIALCMGIGGTLRFVNGGGRNNVTQDEFLMFRKESRQDFKAIFVKLDKINEHFSDLREQVGRIRGAYEGRQNV